jgi:hypothetical protein
MREQEWLACTNPSLMSLFLARTGSLKMRNTRLHTCAVYRHFWDLLDQRTHWAIEVLEDSADGASALENDELQAEWDRAMQFAKGIWQHVAAERVPYECLAYREVFGNPFRNVTIDNPWCTSNTVLSLAQAIYDERAFDRVPVLADALEDAGCDSWNILNHCRQPGEHVRGCWVVDLLLIK